MFLPSSPKSYVITTVQVNFVGKISEEMENKKDICTAYLLTFLHLLLDMANWLVSKDLCVT